MSPSAHRGPEPYDVPTVSGPVWAGNGSASCEGASTMSPRELRRPCADHLSGEFTTRDGEATLATMTDDASVDHVPIHSGGRGKEALRAFYRDIFIPSWPPDLRQVTTNRVVGDNQLVDE